MARTQFVTRYDFRAPGADPDVRREIFGRAIEQAAYVESHGMGALMLSEHHSSADGYLPSPIPVAAAFAAVTSTIPISVSALLVNLYDPIRLAEDMVVLDHLSGGRVSYTIGLGYREEEYALFGKPWSTRGHDIEATIGVLLQAWTGEEFEHEGRRVQVTPTPYSRPHPVLFYGGGSPAAAKRAARLGLHFQPQDSDPALKQVYDDECRAQGREPGFTMQARPGPANVFCTADPDAFWAKHGHHLLADAQAYAAWRGANTSSYVRDDSSTVEEMKAAGTYVVLTPSDLIEKSLSKEIHLVTSHPACGGLPAEPSWESVRLICETVMPAVRASQVPS
ncbi:LLM class flavin-dependent oxidoreductase [Nocardioides sp.]|uniref:LLM class flavin-dependent oxidoreductase n=1 Tax=Nocardioides sp. TaxID=35761 RepID=UPI0031FEA686|nr:hypothetical protein [Nocardioides sp.]